MESLTKKKRIEGPELGWGLFLLFCPLLILIISGWVSGKIYDSLVPCKYPMDYPFWHVFLRMDLVKGACLAVGGTMAVGIAIWKWRKSHDYAALAIWMTVLWYGTEIARAVCIVFRTEHILNPALTRTSWDSAEAYLDDPIILISQGAVMIAAVALAFYFYKRDKSAQREAG